MVEAIFGLGGVVLGFALSEVGSLLRHRSKIGRLKKALKAECESLLAQIPQVMLIVRQILERLHEQRILPGSSVRPIATIYHSSISELALYLPVKERNLLHVVHEYLRVGDEILSRYDADLIATLRDQTIEDPYGVYIDRMKDLLESYGTAMELLKSFLDGKPIDVFVTRGEVVVRNATPL